MYHINTLILGILMISRQENNYLEAIRYISNTDSIQHQIIQSFRDTSIKGIPYFSSHIRPLSCMPFCSDQYDLTKKLTDNGEKFDLNFKKEVNFEPYTDGFLKSLKNNKCADLVMYFSKPVGNYLMGLIISNKGKFYSNVVENQPPRSPLPYLGRGVMVLFIFDKNGKVVNCFTSGYES